MAWLWSVAAMGFAAANVVLLLNYQRLSLPHVHKRFERQLHLLSYRRESILLEIKELQKTSNKASAAHTRACIFLQSVNVLRNINYVVLCIKTESQRAAMAAIKSQALSKGGNGSQAQVTQVVQAGLRILLALLPRCEYRWEAAILTDADCATALADMRPKGGESLEVTLADRDVPRQRLVAESQKRLWILLRMVHLSSVLPIEAQGQLSSLVERYVRPIILEGRVPLNASRTLELSDDSGKEAFFEAAGHVPKMNPPLPPLANKGNQLLALNDVAGSQESSKSESLKQLSATQRDIVRVLARLPAEVLLGPNQWPQGLQQLEDQDAQDLLHDLLSSILVMLAPSDGGSWAFGGSKRPARPSLVAYGSMDGPQNAAAIRFRYGEKAYNLADGIRTSILLRVATAAAGKQAEEFELPLTDLQDDAPSAEVAFELWHALGEAWPGRFGENALKERTQALRRVTSAVRNFRRVSKHDR
eukprot:TRINITY_DN93828_c0_g1_i1.p1 TRINITY_DN93828_c0_g1~~TRINITY_DN93828_c0_g1_i1.p1  ORF type:complete len:487 (-),score=75.94 TRINITY_DN93828_c0_g1_i1:32-1456(-)